ncbi:hypothetical protein CBL_05373 [Carabus blaptoides fortunei]
MKAPVLSVIDELPISYSLCFAQQIAETSKSVVSLARKNYVLPYASQHSFCSQDSMQTRLHDGQGLLKQAAQFIPISYRISILKHKTIILPKICVDPLCIDRDPDRRGLKS